MAARSTNPALLCRLCPERGPFSDEVGLAVHQKTNGTHRLRLKRQREEVIRSSKRARQTDAPVAGTHTAAPLPCHEVTPQKLQSPVPSATPDEIRDDTDCIPMDAPAPAIASSSPSDVEPGFGFSDRILLEVAPQLTATTLDKLLRALQHPDFDAEQVQWSNREEMIDDLAGNEAWTDEVALTFNGQDMPYLMRADRFDVLQELLLKVDEPSFCSEKLVDEDGSRVFDAGRIHTGKWLQRLEARILQSIDADGILPYFTYSDSSQVTLGGHEFHPIVLYLACGRVHEARKESAFRRIAFLFKPTAECLGLSKTSKADTARLQKLRHDYTNKVFADVFSVFKDASFRATTFKFWRNGRLNSARLVPVLMQHCADIMEANLVANLQGIASQMPIVQSMVPRGSLAAIFTHYPRRTEEGVQQVVARALQKRNSGQWQDALDLLDSHSIFSFQPCGLAGFNGTSWPDLFNADTLHIDKGIADHLVTALRSQLRRRLQSQLDKLCADLPRAEDMQLPYQPFTSKGLHTADKARNFIKVLPVLLLAAEGLARQKDWILLFTAFLEWQRQRDLPQHSSASLDELVDKRIAFQEMALKMWARLGRSWENVPKFFLLREFERCISEFGGAAICSTDFGERSHKAFKQQARFTSRQASTMTAQMVRHDSFVLGCRSALEQLDQAAEVPRITGALQLAARDHRPTPLKSYFRLTRDTAGRSLDLQAWLHARQELQHLFPTLDGLQRQLGEVPIREVDPVLQIPVESNVTQ